MQEFLFTKAYFKLGGAKRFPGLGRWMSKSRMKPSFFIVGFQKCGTTSLYELLCSHPSVKRGLLKENNMLAEPKNRLNEFELCFPVKQKGKITGDASHLHTWMPYGLERIKKTYPDAKILVIMRNPIDRAFSLFNMDKKVGYLPPSLTFEQYIDIEFKLRESIENVNDPDSQYEHMRFYGNKYGWALSRGLYHLYLQKLEMLGLKYHPIFLEELNANFEEEWIKVEDFVGLPHHKIAVEERNKGIYKDTMNAETRTWLERFYEGPNAQLENLLDRSLPWS